MLFFPTTCIRALVIGTRIFLVCSVVAPLTDLPHQKRIFLEPYFFCQFLGEVTIHIGEVQVTKAGPFTQMVVSGTEDRWWFPNW